MDNRTTLDNPDKGSNMSNRNVNRCAFPGCATLTTGERCSRHTPAGQWALVKRLGCGGTGESEALVATCYLPRFEPGDTVTAVVRWQGGTPAADDRGIWRALAAQLNALGLELGVRISVDREAGEPDPGT